MIITILKQEKIKENKSETVIGRGDNTMAKWKKEQKHAHLWLKNTSEISDLPFNDDKLYIVGWL